MPLDKNLQYRPYVNKIYMGFPLSILGTLFAILFVFNYPKNLKLFYLMIGFSLAAIATVVLTLISYFIFF